LFGGSIYHYPNRGQIQWYATYDGALMALEAMYPYLIVKRTQAKVAIRFLKRRPGRGYLPNGHSQRNRALDAKDAIGLRQAREKLYQ